MKSVCVFCGSKEGTSPNYASAAQALGQMLVAKNLRLIYGGGKVGLMGALSTEVLQQGGSVTGIIPNHLVSKEVAALDIEDLRIVGSMHERKALMELK